VDSSQWVVVRIVAVAQTDFRLVAAHCGAYTAIGGPGEAAAEPSPGRWSGTDSERVVSG
jgi:hypothetical protein